MLLRKSILQYRPKSSNLLIHNIIIQTGCNGNPTFHCIDNEKMNGERKT